jgi:hypothetical protein
MTLDEALHEIGAPPGSSLEEARRAYSRKTRTWNPASAPDGLRRLREAWEVVQAALSPPPLPSMPAPAPAPLAGPAPEAPADPPAAASPERKIRLLPMEPVTPKEDTGRVRRILVGAALSALVVASFRIASFQKANEAPTEPPTRMPPSLLVSYASSQEAVNHVCSHKAVNAPFCQVARKYLQAIEAHKCSDAESYLKMLDRAGLTITDRSPDQLRPMEKHEAFYDALEADLARCWKFWNP